MAPLTDPTRLEAYKNALGNWRFGDYIEFRLTETANKWIRRELDNILPKEIGRLMYERGAAGGEIDEVRETRPEWSDEYPFHYDLRFTIQDRLVYIETRLNYQIPVLPDDSTILVVNVHAL